MQAFCGYMKKVMVIRYCFCPLRLGDPFNVHVLLVVDKRFGVCRASSRSFGRGREGCKAVAGPAFPSGGA